jgi:hypothetical protein
MLWTKDAQSENTMKVIHMMYRITWLFPKVPIILYKERNRKEKR